MSQSPSKKSGTRAPPKASGSRAPAKAASQRQLRVAEEVRHVLSAVFTRHDIRDPDLAGETITVTEVRVSPDLKAATAFVARLGRSDIDALLPALKRAAPYLRGQVAHEMRLRIAPTLSFQADTALEYAMHIDTLLHRPEVARDLKRDAEPEQIADDGSEPQADR